jgi:tetratricopeptide (TPR) repeat protein
MSVDPVIQLLDSGDREQAAHLLTDGHRADPTDFRVAHALAVLTLWTAVRQSPPPKRAAGTDWHLCLGLWGALLADPNFWTWLRGDAERRYRTPVPDEATDVVRERLEGWLSETVTRHAGDQVAAALALEVRAARVAAIRGGFAVGAGRTIPGGPLLVQHLELQDACRDLAAGLWASEDVGTRRAAMYFSQLGVARVLLDRDAPVAALASLADLQCAVCAKTAGDTRSPKICRPGCTTFDERNPAYTCRGTGRRRFRADAVELAVQAHLSAARAAIATTEIDVATACGHWQKVAAMPEGVAELKAHLDDFVLPRVRFLRRSRQDVAVAVLEAYQGATSTGPHDELFGAAVVELSRLLAERGVEFANRDRPKLAAAREDLRRAVKLNPSSWYACRNLAVVLQNSAMSGVGSAEDEKAVHRAVRLLEEARAHLRRFPARAAGAELAEATKLVEEDLAGLWNAQAVRAHELGRHDEALPIINKAIAMRPDIPILRQNRAVIRRARQWTDNPPMPTSIGDLGDLDPAQVRVIARLMRERGVTNVPELLDSVYGEPYSPDPVYLRYPTRRPSRWQRFVDWVGKWWWAWITR